MGATPALPAPFDAATPTPPPSDPGSQTGDPTTDAVNNLEHAVAVAPKLAKAPGAALDVATSGGDVTNSAQAVQFTGDLHTTAQAAAVTHQAHKDTHEGGIFGVLDDIGHDVSSIATHPLNDAKDILELPLTVMNAGMKDAQHQFRYLYDVYERHGLMAALGEGLVIMGAAAAGFALTGGVADLAEAGGLAAVEGGAEAAGADAATGAVAEGGESAAEDTGQSLLRKGFKTAGKVLNKAHGNPRAVIPGYAAGYGEAHVLYTDSWNRTASATYKNKQGMLVNPGNVLAGMLGVKGGMGSMLSGTGNALFDLFTDPVNAGLSDTGAAKKLAGGALGPVYDRTFTAENLTKMYTGAATNEAAGKFDPQGKDLLRVIDRMAGSSAAQLYREHPSLSGLIPDEMAAGETPDPLLEDSAYRWDQHGVPLDPTHPQGSYYTPKGSPSSYGAHGGMKTEVFIKKAGRLDVSTDPNVPEAWNAGTAAINKLAGPAELRRLTALQQRDPRLVAEKLHSEFGVEIPPRTGGELDAYGAALARRAGYKSIGFKDASGTGYNDELVGLTHDAVREPGAHHLIKGLGSSATRDEVMERLVHSAQTGEAATRTIPSLSKAGERMANLRRAAANSPTNYLHPIMGGIRHPSTIFGNLGLLTERIPGTSFDPATRSFINKTANLNSGRGLDLLRQQFRMGMGEDQADHIINLMQDADVGTRHTIYRNAQMMTLLGHAGYLPDDVDLESDEWFNQAKSDVLSRLANKPKFREFMQRQFDSLLTLGEPADPDASGHYVATRSGAAPPPLVDEDTGRTFAGAVLRNQTGEVPVMNWSNLHHMAQKLSGGMTFTGSLDDFLMDHVTNPIFKRWILMSGGYAVHVALSEMALNWTRKGFGTMAKATYAVAIGRMTDRVARDVPPEEVDSFSKFAVKLLTGDKVAGKTRSAMAINRLSRMVTNASRVALKFNPEDEREMSKLADFSQVTGGHYSTPGTAAHGSIIDSLDDPVGKANGKMRGMYERSALKRGNRYTTFGPEQEEHLHAWAQHLGVTANDPHSVAAAKAIESAYAAGSSSDDAYAAGVQAALDSLKKMDPMERAAFMADKLKRVGDPASMTPLESWAHVLTENVMAITHDGTDVHDLIPADMVKGAQKGTLLHRIATGSPTYPGDIRHIPVDLRPKAIPGRELVPTIAETPLQRIATLGYKRVLNPIMNFLSRQPLTYAEYSQRYDELEHLETEGVLTHEQVVIKAAAEATTHATRFVHNIQDRTVLDEMMHNWLPFFFAQEQAYRRAGRLLAEDPGAFRRYVMEIQSAHDIVSKQQDSDGNQYFAIPGAGFLDHLTVGALGAIGLPTASVNPTGFGGTLSAANVVFPMANGVRPDISPVVTMSAQVMYHMFEEFGQKYSDFKPVTNAVQGAIYAGVGSEDMQESILQQVIPNTTAYRAIETAEGNDTSFNSAMMMTMQSLAYQQNMAMKKWNDDGQKGPMPAIIPPADASPDQLQAFIGKLKSQTRVVFMMRTILGAVSPVSADVTVNDFGLNQDLQNDITSQGSVAKGFQKFLLAHPEASPYTVAKSTSATGSTLPDTAGALTWLQQNQKLIGQYQYGAMWLMPQPTNAAYSSTAYYEEIANGLRLRDTPAQYLTNLYAASGDQVYYAALAQHEAVLAGTTPGSQEENAEYTRWDAYMQQLQKQQPIWWAQYNSGQRQSDAQQSINQLQDIFSKGLAPKGQQSDDVESLLGAYQSAESNYIQAGQQESYSTAQKQVTDQWISYCDALAKQEPQLASIISSVFRDALTYTNQT